MTLPPDSTSNRPAPTSPTYRSRAFSVASATRTAPSPVLSAATINRLPLTVNVAPSSTSSLPLPAVATDKSLALVQDEPAPVTVPVPWLVE
ncbi:hypothetical protein D3C71_1190550 [compost metagenome]